MTRRSEYRVPRPEVERVADALANRLGIDPEKVRVNFEQGRIEVTVEHVAELLGIEVPE